MKALPLFIALIAISLCSCSATNSLKLKVMNHAGEVIQLFWIDTFKANLTLVPQTRKPIRNNSFTTINTYPGHQFSVQMLNHLPGTDVNFTMGNVEDTFVVKMNETARSLVIEKVDPHQELLEMIHNKKNACLKNITVENNQLDHCLTKALVEEMVHIQDTKKKIEEFRDQMSARLRNYTCADSEMKTTEPIRSFPYKFLDRTYQAHVYLDTPAAKIWSVENFATENECELLIEAARPNLVKATVSDESDGSSTFSENRKAQQAGYEFDEDMRNDSLWPLYDRVIKLVNHHAEMSLQPDGQEGFTVIQYNVGDEYTSHCDGTCDGSFVLPGARVATSVIYCKVPEKGGATSFTTANVFVRPEPLMATFFTYKSFDGQFDSGLTQHSGCPVLEGEKWIATTWLREGVSKENNWQRYDPSGVPVLESLESSSSLVQSESSSDNNKSHDEF